ncbi:sulfatase-like hydrolase/transferase [Candidatus Latescibacterota bacterium]
MKRRPFLLSSVRGVAGMTAAVLGAATSSCNTHVASAPHKRPNILIFLVDDAGWGDFGYHGSLIRTPTIDALVREGVELDRFYTYPVCTPTRAGMMLGCPPSRFGLTSAVSSTTENEVIPRDRLNLASMLRGNGYDTAMSGKWHLGNVVPDLAPNAYGFNHSYGHIGPGVDFYTHRSWGDVKNWHRNGEYVEEEGHATDLITNEALSFLREKRDKTKPFFLYVAYNAPHVPMQEEEKWVAPYRGIMEDESRQFYAGMLTHADDGMHQILQEVAQQGLREDTMVLFFSDNGAEPPGLVKYVQPVPTINTITEYGKYGDSGPFRDMKYSLYEGGIRMPAVISWPGHLQPRKVDDFMIVYDILPTFAYVAGIDITGISGLEGMNAWPAIEGTGGTGNRTFYWNLGNRQAVFKNGWKLIHQGSRTMDGGTYELYNIVDDPYEQRDLASEQPEVMAQLKEELATQYARDQLH